MAMNSRIGLGIGDKFRNGLDRQRIRHQDDIRRIRYRRDRGDVAHEIETEMLIERGVEYVGQHVADDRVAVGLRLDHDLGADIAAGARPVLDDEILAELFRKPLRGEPRDDVRRAAGREGDDHLDWAGRVGVRVGDAGERRQRGGAHREM
jgi:hypothetical protein